MTIRLYRFERPNCPTAPIPVYSPLRRDEDGASQSKSKSFPRVDLAVESSEALPQVVAHIIREISRGIRPEYDELINSPMLAGWWIPYKSKGVVKGFAYDHARICNGTVTDVAVLVMDKYKRWVWSGESFWRLGL
jgi:hypothetical protein